MSKSGSSNFNILKIQNEEIDNPDELNDMEDNEMSEEEDAEKIE